MVWLSSWLPPHDIQAKLLGLWTSSLWRVRFLERHSWKMPMFKILGTNPGPCTKRANCWGYVFHPKTMGAPSPDLLPKGWMLFDGQVRWKSLIDFLVCYYTRPSQLDVIWRRTQSYVLYISHICIKPARIKRRVIWAPGIKSEDFWRWNVWNLMLPSFLSKYWKLR